ncbi:papilin [Sphaeramia orbicularis]|uniref:papilin n=1 Tax=Sphaeramia orbicularis TaxID=375764 RepID=UPI00117F6A73|nr:papilin-like [Sphaeramia orbicularis]
MTSEQQQNQPPKPESSGQWSDSSPADTHRIQAQTASVMSGGTSEDPRTQDAAKTVRLSDPTPEPTTQSLKWFIVVYVVQRSVETNPHSMWFTTVTNSRKEVTTTGSKMKHLLFFGIAFAVLHISNQQSTPDFCQLAPDEGEGPSFQFAMFYDPAIDKCSPFIYKGQGGNANRFNNERECIRNCSVNAEDIYPMDVSKACHFPKANGKCSGRFLRYYYDSVYDRCRKFHWSGCYGNGNRFFDQITCNATCDGIHDDRYEDEDIETDTPIAIICGVLLAVIVSAILITVIVLTVKSKKNKGEKKAPGRSKEQQSDLPLQEREDMS